MNKENRIVWLWIFMWLLIIITIIEIDLVNSQLVYDKSRKEYTIEGKARISLNTPQINYVNAGKDILVAEFTIQSLEELNNVFNKMDFYDLNNKNKLISRNFKYRYYYQGRWIDLDTREKITSGRQIRIGVFTDVYKGDYVEWVATILGESLDEWSVWADSNFVSYWKMNETSGTNIEDSLHKLNGTLYGVGLFFNNSDGIYFNGSGGTINFSNNNIWNFSNGSFSISLWFFPKTNDRMSLFSGSTDFWFGFDYQSDKLCVYASSTGSDWDIINGDAGGDGRGTINLSVGQWNHLVIIRNGTQWRTIVNGVKDIDVIVPNGTITSINNEKRIGKWGNQLYFLKGVVKEFKLYNGSVIADTFATVHSPVNEQNFITRQILFNSTIDSLYPLINVSLYINGVFNDSSGITGYLNYTNYTKVLLKGDYNYSYMICTSNECVNTSVLYFHIKNVVENSQTYNNNALEGSTENFKINISYDSSNYGINVKLIYNGTNYSSTQIGSGDNLIFERYLTVPYISSQTNFTFYWVMSLSNSTGVYSYNSTFNNQSVYKLSIDNCTLNNVELFNITMLDEDTQDILNGVTENTSIKLSFELYSLSKSVSILNISYFFDRINPVRICMNATLNDSTYRLDGEIQYSSNGRFKEFYNFQNYSLNNATSGMDILLYDLSNSTGYPFKITYKDSNFIPISNALIYIQRRYVNEGKYKTVEIPKTSSEGFAMANLVINNEKYNIVVMKEGKVLATFEEVVPICQNPLISSCYINLNSYGTSTIPSTFENADDISFTMDYDKSTREISSLFVIPSGVSSNVLLNVTKFDNLGTTSVCSSSLYASGGTLSCIVPESFGNTTVIASIYKDGQEVGYSILLLKQNPMEIYGSNLIFIALLIFLIFIGIGATSDSPFYLAIFTIIGSIVLISLNLIYTPSIFGVGATILWFIICVILLIIKGASK